MATTEIVEKQEYSLTDRREMLEDAERRLQSAEADKKRDATVHKENIAAIKQEIKDILQAIDENK